MLNLLVIYCEDVDQNKSFYESFGLRFVEEKHGAGPVHYSSEIDNLVLELYPKGKNVVSQIRLGIKVASLEQLKDSLLQKFPDITMIETKISNKVHLIITDLDGRKIDTTE